MSEQDPRLAYHRSQAIRDPHNAAYHEAAADLLEARAALETIWAMCDPGDVQTPEVLRMGLHFAREQAFKVLEGHSWTEPPAPSPLAEVEAMRGEVESQERAHAEEIARYQARIAEAHRAHASALDKLAWLGHVHSANSRCAACAAYDMRQAAKQSGAPGPLERTVFEPKDRTPAPSGEKETP